MGALLRVAQGIIDEGVDIDEGYLSDENDIEYNVEHWMNDTLTVENDGVVYNGIGTPLRTRGEVHFNDLVEVIQPRDIFNTPPLRPLSDTYRSTRLRSPPPLRRQYSYDDTSYDSDAETVIEEWRDPAISPSDLFFTIDGYDNDA